MFTDRLDAGKQLASRLAQLSIRNPVVLGLPRGGVPVAATVAAVLDAPLDVIVVRKLGLPSQPEVAMGAIGEEGVRLLDRRIIQAVGVSEQQVADVEAVERAVLEERVKRIRAVRPRANLSGQTAVIVDDGIATGATATVACHIARALGTTRVILAAPVAPREVVEGFAAADDVVSVITPDPFRAVGMHYRDFSPNSDEEVLDLMRSAAEADRARGTAKLRPDADHPGRA